MCSLLCSRLIRTEVAQLTFARSLEDCTACSSGSCPECNKCSPLVRPGCGEAFLLTAPLLAVSVRGCVIHPAASAVPGLPDLTEDAAPLPGLAPCTAVWLCERGPTGVGVARVGVSALCSFQDLRFTPGRAPAGGCGRWRVTTAVSYGQGKTSQNKLLWVACTRQASTPRSDMQC